MTCSRKAVFLAAALLFAIGCGESPTPNTASPETQANVLSDLSCDAVAILRQAPGVANVQRHAPESTPSQRIVHIADWHFVDRDLYAADVRSHSREPLSEEAIDRLFAELLDEVEVMQEQQMRLLRWLIEHHGLRYVHIESLAKEDQPIIDAKIRSLREIGEEIAELRKQKESLVANLDDDARRIIAGIEHIEARYRRDLLQLGAAGRLVLSAELAGVLPLEDEKAYRAANPLADDGTVTLDRQKIEERQDGQVRLLLNSGPFSVIVLGGAHELSDNVERLSGGKAEYIRVEVEAWENVAEVAE